MCHFTCKTSCFVKALCSSLSCWAKSKFLKSTIFSFLNLVNDLHHFIVKFDVLEMSGVTSVKAESTRKSIKLYSGLLLSFSLPLQLSAF